MSSKVYDFLRWFSAIFLPALTTFIGVIMTALKIECADAVITIMAAFTTFMNTIVGVNKVSYDRKQKEEEDLAAFTQTVEEIKEKEEDGKKEE